MDPIFRKPIHALGFSWDRRFSTRQASKYGSEDRKLVVPPGDTLIGTFLKARKTELEPLQYNHPELEAFLLASHPPQTLNFNAIVDDRRDETGWESMDQRFFARDWNGYTFYPPEGVNVRYEMLDAVAFKSRLLEPVCHLNHDDLSST